MGNQLATRLRAGRPSFGVSLTIPDPFVAEVLAFAPLDFLMLDSEHSPMSLYQLQTQLIALRTSAASLLVRIPHAEPSVIMQMLDLGADGVVVPHLETAAECAVAVDAAYYPPRGSRGVGPRRAARLAGGQSAYFDQASDVLLIGMLETARGVENLDEILAVPGLGGLTIGQADLSASLGHLGEPDHPDVTAALDRIMTAAREAKVPFGIFAPNLARAEELMAKGATILTVGSDLLFLERATAQAITTVHEARAWESR